MRPGPEHPPAGNGPTGGSRPATVRANHLQAFFSSRRALLRLGAVGRGRRKGFLRLIMAVVCRGRRKAPAGWPILLRLPLGRQQVAQAPNTGPRLGCQLSAGGSSGAPPGPVNGPNGSGRSSGRKCSTLASDRERPQRALFRFPPPPTTLPVWPYLSSSRPLSAAALFTCNPLAGLGGPLLGGETLEECSPSVRVVVRN